MKIEFKKGDVKKYNELRVVFDSLPLDSQHAFTQNETNTMYVIFDKDVTINITVEVGEIQESHNPIVLCESHFESTNKGKCFNVKCLSNLSKSHFMAPCFLCGDKL